MLVPIVNVEAATIGRPQNNLGLVGYWNFDVGKDHATSTTVFDASGSGNTGWLTNATGSANWVEGKIGNGITFDGTDDYIDMGDTTDLEFGGTTAQFTLAAWVYFDSRPADGFWYTIMGKWGETGDEREYVMAMFDDSGKIQVLYSEDGTDVALFDIITSGTNVVDLNQWSHVVTTADLGSDSYKIYVDGVELPTSSDFQAPPISSLHTGTKEFFTGAIESAGAPFLFLNGKIDDARVYNRALSASEIQRLYKLGLAGGQKVNQTPTIVSDGLVAHWTFDGIDYDSASTTAEVLDRSGNANHGDVVGADGSGGEIDYQNTESTVCGSSGTCTLSNFTLASSSGNNRLVVVGASSKWDTNVSDVTFNGVSGRLVFEKDDGSGTTVTASQWYFLDSDLPATAGDYDIVMTSSPNEDQFVGALAFVGVDQSKAMTASSSNANLNCDSETSTLTTTDDNSIVVNVMQGSVAADFTANNSIIETYEEDDGGTAAGGYKFVASEGSATGGFDFSIQQVRCVSIISSYSPAPISTSSLTVLGKLGQALDFDGVDDYVDVGTSLIAAGGNDYTVTVWFYADGTPVSFRELVSQWTNAEINESFFLGFNGDNIRFSDDWNNNDIGTWETETWHHLVAVSTTDNAYIYFDDVLVATKGSALGYTGTGPVVIGKQGEYSGGEFFKGKIDDVRIYNRALSATEIKQIYNATAGTKVNMSTGGILDGLIGHWTFDGPLTSSTVAQDSSVSGNDMTFVGQTKTALGKVGQALTFDGLGDYVYTADDDIFSIDTTNELTVLAWVRPQSFAARIEPVSKGSPSNYEWQIQINTSGALDAVVWTSAGSTFMSPAGSTELLNLNEWEHIAMTIDLSSPSLKTYVNGQFEKEDTTSSGSYTNGTARTQIGERDDGDGDMNGEIDDVRVYNRVLTPAEITRLYNMGK